jgi:hypothetical protein
MRMWRSTGEEKGDPPTPTVSFSAKELMKENKEGGAVMLTSSSEKKLNITTTNFSSCNALKEGSKGGAMYLHVTTIDSLLCFIFPLLSDNHASSGNHIFIESDIALQSVVTPTSFSFISPFHDENDFVGVGGSPFSSPVDLHIVISKYTTLPLFVDDGGVDGVWCGHPSYPCHSIGEFVDHHVEEEGVVRIVIDSTFTISSTLTLNDIEIEGKTKGEVPFENIIFSSIKSCTNYVENGHSSSLSHLIFSFSSVAPPVSSLFLYFFFFFFLLSHHLLLHPNR